MTTAREATGTAPTERIDSQRNRRRLIEAATDAIAEKGLEVSALDIATHAGLGVGTLYRRFGTKEALIEGVLVSCSRRPTARWPMTIPGGASRRF